MHLSQLSQWVSVIRSYLLQKSGIYKICSSWQNDIASWCLGSWNLPQGWRLPAQKFLLSAYRIIHWCWAISSTYPVQISCLFHAPNPHSKALNHIITNYKGCTIQPLPYSSPASPEPVPSIPALPTWDSFQVSPKPRILELWELLNASTLSSLFPLFLIEIEHLGKGLKRFEYFRGRCWSCFLFTTLWEWAVKPLKEPPSKLLARIRF